MDSLKRPMKEVDSLKRPRKEQRSREDLLLEIQEMKSIMMRYCSTTSTLEDAADDDVHADDTAEIHKNLMDLKKSTEDMKSMSEDLICKQRQAYDELTQALQRMTQIATNYSSGNRESFSDEDFQYAVQLAEEQKEEIDELKREKKDLEAELEELKEIVDHSMGDSSTTSTYRRRCKSSAGSKYGCYKEFKKRTDKLKQKLQKKEVELEDMDAFSTALIVQERSLNDELQEARKELIRGLGDECNKSVLIGLKRMGALDPTSFDSVLPKKDDGKGSGGTKGNTDGGKFFSPPSKESTAEITESVQLCSFWESNLRDQSWHPFKIIEVQGKQEEVIDGDDELLKGARDEFGEEVYKAITTAAMELNEYNPNVREPVQEIWNFKEKRRATTKEAISLVLKQLKSCRQLKASRRSAR